MAAAGGSIDPALVQTVADVGKALGDLFLRLLQMLVVPLIVSSLITGITGMGDLRKLGRLGGRTVAFYLATSFIAIVTGVMMVNLLNPGQGADLGLLEAGAGDAPEVIESGGHVGQILWAQLEGMVPTNPLKAAADGDMLPLIFFSIVLGIFISAVEHQRSPEAAPASEDEGPYREGPTEPDDLAEERAGAALLRRFFAGLFAVMMRMTLVVIRPGSDRRLRLHALRRRRARPGRFRGPRPLRAHGLPRALYPRPSSLCRFSSEPSAAARPSPTPGR